MEEILELIRKERERQIVAKGYTFEQDDKLTHGRLTNLAIHYLAESKVLNADSINRIPELVKAAALIVAEIQRIKRVEHKGAGEIPMTANQFKHFVSSLDKDMRERDEQQIKEIGNEIADAVIKRVREWARESIKRPEQ